MLQSILTYHALRRNEDSEPEKRMPIACTNVGWFALFAVALIAGPAWAQAQPTAVTWGEQIQLASGGAYQGPWRMNESAFHYVDDPTVAINDEGVIAIAWVNQSQKDIFFQAHSPDGEKRFEQPVNVSRTPKIFSWLPRMAMTSDDPNTVYLVWQEIVFSGGSHGGEIFFSRSSDGGRSFADPLNLSDSIAGDGKGRLTPRYWHNGSLDLVVGPQRTLYVAWTEYEGSL